MEIKKFIENYREAFGEYAELPIVFWYSDILENETGKVNGCFFKSMSKVRGGNTISLNADGWVENLVEFFEILVNIISITVTRNQTSIEYL